MSGPVMRSDTPPLSSHRHLPFIRGGCAHKEDGPRRAGEVRCSRPPVRSQDCLKNEVQDEEGCDPPDDRVDLPGLALAGHGQAVSDEAGGHTV